MRSLTSDAYKPGKELIVEGRITLLVGVNGQVGLLNALIISACIVVRYDKIFGCFNVLIVWLIDCTIPKDSIKLAILILSSIGLSMIDHPHAMC